jgi:hypothetical protein
MALSLSVCCLTTVAAETPPIHGTSNAESPEMLILIVEGVHRRHNTDMSFKGTVKLADSETEFGNNLASEQADWTLNRA